MTVLKASLVSLACVATAGILATSAAAMGADRGDEAPIDYFPGINCRVDHGRAIDTICSSDRLMFLEDKITQRYSEAAAHANKAAFDVLLHDQREYLADRDACGSNRDCLEMTLKARLHAVR